MVKKILIANVMCLAVTATSAQEPMGGPLADLAARVAQLEQKIEALSNPAGTGRVLIDKNGVIVGTVVSDSAYEALVEFEVDGQAVRTDFNWYGPTPEGLPYRLYLTSDCTGQTFLFFDRRIVWPGPFVHQDGQTNVFYTFRADATPVELTAYSFSYASDWSCLPVPEGMTELAYLESDFQEITDPFQGLERPFSIVPLSSLE